MSGPFHSVNIHNGGFKVMMTKTAGILVWMKAFAHTVSVNIEKNSNN